jgi:hypothetical protein
MGPVRPRRSVPGAISAVDHIGHECDLPDEEAPQLLVHLQAQLRPSLGGPPSNGVDGVRGPAGTCVIVAETLGEPVALQALRSETRTVALSTSAPVRNLLKQLLSQLRTPTTAPITKGRPRALSAQTSAFAHWKWQTPKTCRSSEGATHSDAGSQQPFLVGFITRAHDRKHESPLPTSAMRIAATGSRFRQALIRLC